MSPLTAAGKRLRDQRPDYRAADGRKVPSVTTVLGVIAKPWLVAWGNRLGLQGIDSSLYVQEAAGAGTLAHAAIEAALKGVPIDDALVSEFSVEERVAGRIAWGNFTDWRRQHDIEPILVEYQLVSERMRVGGTVDCFAVIDGRRTVLDFKTSVRVYESHVVQLAAYRALLEEAGHQVDEVRVVLLPREPLVLDYEHERVIEDTSHALDVFRAARALYAAQRVMEQAQRANRKAAREENTRVEVTPEVTQDTWAKFKGL